VTNVNSSQAERGKQNGDGSVRRSRSVWIAAASAPLLERTETFLFLGVLVRPKAPLKQTQSRRFAIYPRLGGYKSARIL
jgi:hypothetical protein